MRQIIENEKTPKETAQVMNNNAQQIFSYGNTKPAEAFYSHIEPKALGQFMLGCAKIAAQTGNHMRTLQASILNKMAKAAIFLHNTTPPKPTYFPNSQTPGTCSDPYLYSHPALNMATSDLMGLNLGQPIIYASTHHLWTWQAPVQSEKDVLNQLQQNIDLYQQAVAEAQNGDYTGLIVIVSQWLPKNWRDYQVGCYELGQQTT